MATMKSTFAPLLCSKGDFCMNHLVKPHHIALLGAVGLLSVALTGCDSKEASIDKMPSSEKISEVVSTLHQSAKDVSSTVQDSVQQIIGTNGTAIQNLTTEQLMRLFKWEYRVVDVGTDKPAEEMNATLTELGDQNWECFSILQIGAAVRITCKKRPASALEYLKYIPHF